MQESGENIISQLRQITGTEDGQLRLCQAIDNNPDPNHERFYQILFSERESILQSQIGKLVIALDANPKTISQAQELNADLFLFVNDDIHNNDEFQRISKLKRMWNQHLEMVLSDNGLSVRLARFLFPDSDITLQNRRFGIGNVHVPMTKSTINMEEIQRKFPNAKLLNEDGVLPEGKLDIQVIAGNGGVNQALEGENIPQVYITGGLSADEEYRRRFLKNVEKHGTSIILLGEENDEGRRISELYGLCEIILELRRRLPNLDIQFLDEEECRQSF